jgi:hypothetical protein
VQIKSGWVSLTFEHCWTSACPALDNSWVLVIFQLCPVMDSGSVRLGHFRAKVGLLPGCFNSGHFKSQLFLDSSQVRVRVIKYRPDQVRVICFHSVAIFRFSGWIKFWVAHLLSHFQVGSSFTFRLARVSRCLAFGCLRFWFVTSSCQFDFPKTVSGWVRPWLYQVLLPLVSTFQVHYESFFPLHLFLLHSRRWVEQCRAFFVFPGQKAWTVLLKLKVIAFLQNFLVRKKFHYLVMKLRHLNLN